MVVQVTRDIAFGGRVLIRKGAIRIVSAGDVVTNAWLADGRPCGKALFVPTDDGGHVALGDDDLVVIPDPIGGITDTIPF